jgi:hypothetical protein
MPQRWPYAVGYEAPPGPENFSTLRPTDDSLPPPALDVTPIPVALPDPSGAPPPAGSSPPPAAHPQAVPGRLTLLGAPGYVILDELGRGAMGVVYKARQIALNRVVVLKMILAGEHAAAGAVQRFRAEAEAVARLHHPNIVQVYEVAQYDGRPFFSLEYVEGGTLGDKFGGTPLAPGQAATLVETLARATQHAHEQGVVHRDLKPDNVLLTPGGEPKITDFGLARQTNAGSGATRSGDVFGTPSYMAPEQADGRTHTAGPAADVYALGAILYECLTGRPPFKGNTTLATLHQVLVQEPVSPTRLNFHVPRDLETVCLKCLQKDPARRYASAGELADDLARFVRGEPVRARPVGALGSCWRWARRNRVLAGAVAAALVGLVATAAVSVAAAVIARKDACRVAAAHHETEQALEELRATHADLARAHDERAATNRDLRDLLVFGGQVAEGVGSRMIENGEHGRGMLWLAHALKLVSHGADATGAEQCVRRRLADCLARGGWIGGAEARPDPATDPAERIELWAQGVTGLEIGPDGALRSLTAEEHVGRRRQWETSRVAKR